MPFFLSFLFSFSFTFLFYFFSLSLLMFFFLFLSLFFFFFIFLSLFFFFFLFLSLLFSRCFSFFHVLFIFFPYVPVLQNKGREGYQNNSLLHHTPPHYTYLFKLWTVESDFENWIREYSSRIYHHPFYTIQWGGGGLG